MTRSFVALALCCVALGWAALSGRHSEEPQPRAEPALIALPWFPEYEEALMPTTTTEPPTTTTTEAPRPVVQPAPVQRTLSFNPDPNGWEVWDQLAICESGGNWQITGGGYEGGLEFLHSTWIAWGGRDFAEHANEATREQQITVARRGQAASGWVPWPACSIKLGLR